MDEALTYKGMQIAMTPSLVSGESHAVVGIFVARAKHAGYTPRSYRLPRS
jgi:hypothetical protein